MPRATALGGSTHWRLVAAAAAVAIAVALLASCSDNPPPVEQPAPPVVRVDRDCLTAAGVEPIGELAVPERVPPHNPDAARCYSALGQEQLFELLAAYRDYYAAAEAHCRKRDPKPDKENSP
jgi:hypothetical protein